MDQVIEQAVTPQVQPGQPVEPKPLNQREQIYQNFYTANPETAPPVGEPQVNEQPVAEVAPVVAPVVDELTQLKQQLAELKAQIAPPPPPPPAAPTQEQQDWLKLLSEGKKEEAEEALFRTKAGQELANRIQQEAVERMVVERQIYEFNSQVVQANPDLQQFQDYITYGVQARIAQASQAGKTQTPADYVTVYKEAVNAEIEKARNLAQSIRGAGKNEALVRQQQVVSSQTLQPNPVNQNREQSVPQNSNQPPAETVDDYFAKRRLQEQRGRGLLVRG